MDLRAAPRPPAPRACSCMCPSTQRSTTTRRRSFPRAWPAAAADGRCPGRGEDGQPSAQHGRRPVSAAERPDRTHGTHGKGSGVARQLAGRPRVIIAGAGFGGITCARALKRVDVDVLLIDRNNYHLFTPLLYQVASALLDPGEIARPVRELVRPLRNVEFRQAEITGADLPRRLLLTDHGPIPYDLLVLATEAHTDVYGNESVARNALAPDDLVEALALRNREVLLLEA